MLTLDDVEGICRALGAPCIIPLVKALRNTEGLTPADVYAALYRGQKHSFLLESAELGEKVARYSFLGADPEDVITLKKGRMTVKDRSFETDRPLKELHSILTRCKVHRGRLPKFFGGLLGYFSYDMVRYFEDIGGSSPDVLGHPDAQFMFVKDLIVFDHWRDEILLVSNIIVEDTASAEEEYGRACSQISRMEELIKEVTPRSKGREARPRELVVKSNFEKEDFEEAVRKAKEHIYAGDIFQVVLSQRFEVEGEFDAFTVYEKLKEINPSPYMYLLDLGEIRIIGSSPEILVKVDGRTVTVRPIAGTRPRGSDIVEDEELAREMVNDEKERAEHVMLVDLGRNDVGRVSRFGTVEVTEFFGIEKYSHVQHIISNVRGELREGCSSFDVLRAAFPAGTVTGAPKIRAMQIIEELEPSRRGIYAGSVGYFSFDGNMDFAITIRTIVLQGGRAYVQAGAGIVADSIPEREYEETLNKGRGMVKALELAGGDSGG